MVEYWEFLKAVWWVLKLVGNLGEKMAAEKVFLMVVCSVLKSVVW